jgi:hypothetical protein
LPCTNSKPPHPINQSLKIISLRRMVRVQDIGNEIGSGHG